MYLKGPWHEISTIRKSDSAANSTAVSLTPLWHVQRCQWHRCANMKPLSLWTSYSKGSGNLKGNIYRKNIQNQTVHHYIYIYTQNMGVKKRSFLSQWHHCDENWLFHSRFALRIRSHIQKGFNPCIMGLGVDFRPLVFFSCINPTCVTDQRVESCVRLFFYCLIPFSCGCLFQPASPPPPPPP
jgi:hypothetical protein